VCCGGAANRGITLTFTHPTEVRLDRASGEKGHLNLREGRRTLVGRRAVARLGDGRVPSAGVKAPMRSPSPNCWAFG